MDREQTQDKNPDLFSAEDIAGQSSNTGSGEVEADCPRTLTQIQQIPLLGEPNQSENSLRLGEECAFSQPTGSKCSVVIDPVANKCGASGLQKPGLLDHPAIRLNAIGCSQGPRSG